VVRVGNQARDQLHEEIERTAVASMLDLAAIFELVVNRLDD